MDSKDYDKLFEFVASHRGEDAIRLRLKYRDAGDIVASAITHLQCLDKAGDKFKSSTGVDLTPKLFVAPLSVEQATAADIALFHASLVPDRSSVLDMTGGLGIDARAIALVSHATMTVCEMNPLYAEGLAYNLSDLPAVKVVNCDSVEFLSQTEAVYDIIFIDPARRGEEGKRLYNLHDCTPDLTALLPVMFQKAPVVMAKLSPMLDVTQTVRDLPGISRLYVVDDGHECKELFAVICRGFEGEPEIVIRTRDLNFSFTLSQERESLGHIALPAKGLFLYEPAPATMKAAPFKLLTDRFDGLGKLADNTNLFVSESHYTSFPGRVLEILDVIDFSSGNIKRFSSRYPEINITARNFPMTVDQLYKKLHVRQGGKLRLFVTTLADYSKCMIVARDCFFEPKLAD